MVSTRPYLIRAIFDWAVDNAFTPYLLVDASVDGTEVPAEFVQDGSIVLNIHPNAVRDLSMGDEFVSFNARFAGVAQQLFVPVEAVRAIYAKETGEGIMLPPDAQHAPQMIGENSELGGNQPSPDDTPDGPRPSAKKPHLKIVE